MMCLLEKEARRHEERAERGSTWEQLEKEKREGEMTLLSFNVEK